MRRFRSKVSAGVFYDVSRPGRERFLVDVVFLVALDVWLFQVEPDKMLRTLERVQRKE